VSAPLNTSVNAETGECSKLRMSGVTVGEIAVMSAMWSSVRMIDVMAYCLSLRRRARRRAIYQHVGANHAYRQCSRGVGPAISLPEEAPDSVELSLRTCPWPPTMTTFLDILGTLWKIEGGSGDQQGGGFTLVVVVSRWAPGYTPLPIRGKL
jgi:hypothetical protein